MRFLLLTAAGCGGLSAHAVYVSGAVQDTAPAPVEADTDTDTDSDADTDPTTPTGPGGLLISEVADYADSDDARYLELWNAGADRNLSGLALRRYSNGSSDYVEAALPDFTLTSDARYVIAYNQTAFVAVFGADASAYSGVASGNGNDVYELVVTADGTVVDVYGVVGVDGTGEAWEYLDSIAQRNAGITTGSDAFDVAQWTITPGTSAATPGQ
jgi:hypothetical protein